MDIALLVQLIQLTMLRPITATAKMVSILINTESALENAEPMKPMTLLLINVYVLKVLEESTDNVQFAHQEPKLLLMRNVLTVESMSNF